MMSVTGKECEESLRRLYRLNRPVWVSGLPEGRLTRMMESQLYRFVGG